MVRWFTFSVIYLDRANDQIFFKKSDAYNFSPVFKKNWHKVVEFTFKKLDFFLII